MSYRLTVNAKELTQGTLREVQAAVADLITRRLNSDPARLAPDAQMVNMAFSSGAVQQQLDETGQWYTVFDAFGEDQQRIRVTKEE
jgi:hypothetical protein